MYIYACIGSTLMIVTIGRLLPKETTRQSIDQLKLLFPLFAIETVSLISHGEASLRFIP